MTSAERVKRVAGFGFTDRQAAFLIEVMLHSGFFLGRQYCAFARIVRHADRAAPGASAQRAARKQRQLRSGGAA